MISTLYVLVVEKQLEKPGGFPLQNEGQGATLASPTFRKTCSQRCQNGLGRLGSLVNGPRHGWAEGTGKTGPFWHTCCGGSGFSLVERGTMSNASVTHVQRDLLIEMSNGSGRLGSPVNGSWHDLCWAEGTGRTDPFLHACYGGLALLKMTIFLNCPFYPSNGHKIVI